MINSLYFKPNNVHCCGFNGVNVPQQNVSQTLPCQKQSQELMPKEMTAATRAYALVAPKLNVPIDNKTLDERKKELLEKGKVEGRDFEVKKTEVGTILNIYENGKVSERYGYKNDGKSKGDFRNLNKYSYPIGTNSILDSVCTTYAPDGRIEMKTFNYKADNSPYKNDLAYQSASVAEYRNYLASQGINYTESNKKIGNVGRNVIFSFVEPNTGKPVEYNFIVNNDGKTDVVEKTIKDKFGGMRAKLVFENNKTAYTEFY